MSSDVTVYFNYALRSLVVVAIEYQRLNFDVRVDVVSSSSPLTAIPNYLYYRELPYFVILLSGIVHLPCISIVYVIGFLRCFAAVVRSSLLQDLTTVLL